MKLKTKVEVSSTRNLLVHCIQSLSSITQNGEEEKVDKLSNVFKSGRDIFHKYLILM